MYSLGSTMKSTKTKHKLLFTLILAIHIMSVQAAASHDVRILIVGIRGHSRFSAADILSGRKDGGQEDREIVKTPVITDEGRRMMLVTGPNLCEEDTARQSFTTALFLSSPGPHAVLMVLNLEDEASEQCDIVKRAQELLGAEVLQYCIVLLHQERFTGASRGIAGEMINACGGRFHMIRDSEPKPAQTAALVEEIDKLVWLNGDGFYSVLTQELETEETSQDVHEEIQHLSVIYDTLGGAAGIIGWIFLISLTALVIYTGGNDKFLNFGAKFAALVLFMIYLRHLLSPDVAIPLNLSLLSSLATIFTTDRRVIEEFNFSRSSSSPNIKDIIGDFIVNILIYLILFYAELMSLPFIQGSALVFGTIISVRSWSDVLIACHAAPGVTAGAYAFIFQHEKISRESPVLVLGSFLCCIIGATLSMGFVTVFALLDVKMTVMLLILGLTMAYWHLKTETLHNVIGLTVLTLFFSCGCVLIGSVFLILGLIMSFLKVLTESLVRSCLFYVALLLIVMWRKQIASVQVRNSD
ncbi:uncharacterized protein LOC127507702 isoform X2 [Ctenopharyngodon idella]|uniref:uncharacterized protein LOC127507702 isoform X2 n=2 Tax=Ctenopharyngodon idella TaxID=7959 RepID=UPI00222EAA2E|nr:uncharacterized protein LOC127507702 isoform X2 [Ctenopharyngodon idella]XP_051740958.1 uncharacterized protein LOC127507702 isoform X2 [Ctenopharyngodon idella]